MKQRILGKEMLTVLLLAVPVLWSGMALADGDYNAGARKSIYCAYCHGYDGNPIDAAIPRLAGRKAEDIIARIKSLEANGAMHQSMLKAFVAGELGDQDVVDLATFFSRQPVHTRY